MYGYAIVYIHMYVSDHGVEYLHYEHVRTYIHTYVSTEITYMHSGNAPGYTWFLPLLTGLVWYES